MFPKSLEKNLFTLLSFLITPFALKRKSQKILEKYADILSQTRMHVYGSGSVYALGTYSEPPLKAAIAELKFHRSSHAAKVLSTPVNTFLHEWIQSKKDGPVIIVSVPLTRKRMRERGYDQLEFLLSHNVDTKIDAHYKKDILVKNRETEPQTHLPHNTRKENVSNAFTCVTSIDGARVLLIDDVFTTGSTARACSDALKKAGAATVEVCVLAYAGTRH